MILQRTENARWLSNAYLVVDDARRSGVLVDANQAMDPLLERIHREEIGITHVLLTHHHEDHVEGVAEVAARVGAPVLASLAAGRDLPDTVDETFADGDLIASGGLRIEVLDTPGHMEGHACLLVDGTDCLTGDVLFAGTVGGTAAPQATGYADLRRSIMDRLMTLDPAVRVHPGHRGPTTIGAEREGNPFVRVWRGLDPEGDEPCLVDGGRAARLVLWAPDYDGGHKAWVRFPEGEDVIVGGSRVERGRE